MKTFSIRDSSVNGSSKEAEISLARAVKSLTGGKKPVFVCIGTDAVTGDSLGPLTGTVLSGKLRGKAYVLGTLDRPLTALDVNIASEFVKKVYPYGVVVAVDAALGRKEEVGSVLVSDSPVKPGLGVRKNLDERILLRTDSKPLRIPLAKKLKLLAEKLVYDCVKSSFIDL